MPGATPRLQLPYPVPNDVPDGAAQIKALADKLDPSTTIDLQGTAAARPAAGTAGRYYFATDTEELSRDTGTGWTLVSAGTKRIDAQGSAAAGQAGWKMNWGQTNLFFNGSYVSDELTVTHNLGKQPTNVQLSCATSPASLPVCPSMRGGPNDTNFKVIAEEVGGRNLGPGNIPLYWLVIG